MEAGGAEGGVNALSANQRVRCFVPLVGRMSAVGP